MKTFQVAECIFPRLRNKVTLNMSMKVGNYARNSPQPKTLVVVLPRFFSKNSPSSYLGLVLLRFFNKVSPLSYIGLGLPRFFSKVSPSSYLGWMEGLEGNLKPIYEVCDSKSEKSTSMYCFEGTPLRYSLFAWIMGLTNLAQKSQPKCAYFAQYL